MMPTGSCCRARWRRRRQWRRHRLQPVRQCRDRGQWRDRNLDPEHGRGRQLCRRCVRQWRRNRKRRRDRLRPCRLDLHLGRRRAWRLAPKHRRRRRGAIDYSQAGDVMTAGDGAIGIIAQSLAGGGGYIDGVFGNARRLRRLPARSRSASPARSSQMATDRTARSCRASAAATAVTSITPKSATSSRSGDNSIGIAAQSLGGGGSLDESALGGSAMVGEALTPLAVPAEPLAR